MIIDFDMANINESNIPIWKKTNIQDYTITISQISNSLSFVLPYYLDTFNTNPLNIQNEYNCLTIEECCKKYNIACDCESMEDCCKKYGLFCDCISSEDCCNKFEIYCDLDSLDDCKSFDYTNPNISSISGIPNEIKYSNLKLCISLNGCLKENSPQYNIVNKKIPSDFSKALDCCSKANLGISCSFICGIFDKIKVTGSSVLDDGWYSPKEIIDKLCNKCTDKNIKTKIIKEEDSDYFYFYLVRYNKLTNEECDRELIKKIPKSEDKCIDKNFLQKIAEYTINIKNKCETTIDGKITFNSNDDYINYNIYIVANNKKICEFELNDTDTYVSISGDKNNITLTINYVKRNYIEVTENNDYDMYLEIYDYSTGKDEKHYYKVEKSYNTITCGNFRPTIGSNKIEVFYLNKKCIKVKKIISKN